MVVDAILPKVVGFKLCKVRRRVQGSPASPKQSFLS
jgi:hypothetical protein